jgi:proline racemase
LTSKVLKGGDYRYSVETEAFVTGSHEFIFDQDDPLKEGFLLA